MKGGLVIRDRAIGFAGVCESGPDGDVQAEGGCADGGDVAVSGGVGDGGGVGFVGGCRCGVSPKFTQTDSSSVSSTESLSPSEVAGSDID